MRTEYQHPTLIACGAEKIAEPVCGVPCLLGVKAPAFSRTAAFCKRSKADKRLGGRQPDCRRARCRCRQSDLPSGTYCAGPSIRSRKCPDLGTFWWITYRCEIKRAKGRLREDRGGANK